MLNEEVKNAYFNALYNQQNGSNASMMLFKNEFPKEFALINGAYHKRAKIRENIKAMQEVGTVYFGTLTFDNEKDKNKEVTKRKECWSFLNSLFSCLLLVEEHGEKNGRYHVHFVGIFKSDKHFKEFRQWHSRQNLEIVKKVQKVVNYICDYVVKDLPRIRRNKPLIKLCNEYKTLKRSREIGFTFYEDVFKSKLFSIIDLNV